MSVALTGASRYLDPALIGPSPCCGKQCTIARVTEERGTFHVRLEFWGDRHDRHLFVPAIHVADDEGLVAWVNEALAGAALVA